MTPSDWAFIKDKRKHLNAKLTSIVERANKLGVTFHDEETCKWMLAVILIGHYDEMPSPHHIYDKLQELKGARAVEKRPYPHALITTYPEFPSELPSYMFEYAYSDEKPTHTDLQGILAIGSKIP